MTNPEPSQTSPWLTVDEAAEYLRVSRNTVYRWIQEGVLKYWEGPGGHRRFRVEDLDAAHGAGGEDQARADAEGKVSEHLFKDPGWGAPK